MSEFKSNFLLYQLMLEDVLFGDGQRVYNRNISFPWKQTTAVNVDDLPEFTFVFDTHSFNERAKKKGFPNVKVFNSQHTLNDIRLSADEGGTFNDDTPQSDSDTPRPPKVGTLNISGRVTDVTPEFVKDAVLLTIVDLTGSKDVALRFMASSPDPINTFDDYFAPKVQTRLREALRRVYTIMQTIIPTLGAASNKYCTLSTSPDSNSLLRLNDFSTRSPSFTVCDSILTTPHPKVTVIYDTGASTSCVPIQFIRRLKEHSYNWKSAVTNFNTFDASGNKIEIYYRLVNIRLKIRDFPTAIIVKNAIVADFRNREVYNQILLGINDIRRNNINLTSSDGDISISMGGVRLPFKDVSVDTRTLRSVASLSVPAPTEFTVASDSICLSDINKFFAAKDRVIRVYHSTSLSDYTKLRLPNAVPSLSLVAITPSENISLSTEKLVSGPSNPNCFITLRRGLDLEYQRSLDSYSHTEVLIDPDNTLDWPEEVKRSRFAQLSDLVQEFKDIFQDTVGEVRNPEFIVRATIDEEASTVSTNKSKNYFDSMIPAVKDAILKKFQRELSQGVLVPCSNLQIIPKNILPIFGVPKKGAPSEQEFLDATRVRLIADCSRGVNKATSHRAAATDDIKFVSRRIARYTENGFTFSVDIADAFYCFKLSDELMPYFCVQHPIVGNCAYTRLPQG